MDSESSPRAPITSWSCKRLVSEEIASSSSAVAGEGLAVLLFSVGVLPDMVAPGASVTIYREKNYLTIAIWTLAIRFPLRVPPRFKFSRVFAGCLSVRLIKGTLYHRYNKNRL